MSNEESPSVDDYIHAKHLLHAILDCVDNDFWVDVHYKNIKRISESYELKPHEEVNDEDPDEGRGENQDVEEEKQDPKNKPEDKDKIIQEEEGNIYISEFLKLELHTYELTNRADLDTFNKTLAKIDEKIPTNFNFRERLKLALCAACHAKFAGTQNATNDTSKYIEEFETLKTLLINKIDETRNASKREGLGGSEAGESTLTSLLEEVEHYSKLESSERTNMQSSQEQVAKSEVQTSYYIDKYTNDFFDKLDTTNELLDKNKKVFEDVKEAYQTRFSPGPPTLASSQNSPQNGKEADLGKNLKTMYDSFKISKVPSSNDFGNSIKDIFVEYVANIKNAINDNNEIYIKTEFNIDSKDKLYGTSLSVNDKNKQRQSPNTSLQEKDATIHATNREEFKQIYGEDLAGFTEKGQDYLIEYLKKRFKITFSKKVVSELKKQVGEHKIKTEKANNKKEEIDMFDSNAHQKMPLLRMLIVLVCRCVYSLASQNGNTLEKLKNDIPIEPEFLTYVKEQMNSAEKDEDVKEEEKATGENPYLNIIQYAYILQNMRQF